MLLVVTAQYKVLRDENIKTYVSVVEVVTLKYQQKIKGTEDMIRVGRVNLQNKKYKYFKTKNGYSTTSAIIW